jgi:hypothetical protein
MENEEREEKIEEINLWPLPGGRFLKARIFSDVGKIYQLDIDDPEKGATISLNSPSLMKLLRFLSGKDFAGVREKLIVK